MISSLKDKALSTATVSIAYLLLGWSISDFLHMLQLKYIIKIISVILPLLCLLALYLIWFHQISKRFLDNFNKLFLALYILLFAVNISVFWRFMEGDPTRPFLILIYIESVTRLNKKLFLQKLFTFFGFIQTILVFWGSTFLPTGFDHPELDLEWGVNLMGLSLLAVLYYFSAIYVGFIRSWVNELKKIYATKNPPSIVEVISIISLTLVSTYIIVLLLWFERLVSFEVSILSVTVNLLWLSLFFQKMSDSRLNALKLKNSKLIN